MKKLKNKLEQKIKNKQAENMVLKVGKENDDKWYVYKTITFENGEVFWYQKDNITECVNEVLCDKNYEIAVLDKALDLAIYSLQTFYEDNDEFTINKYKAKLINQARKDLKKEKINGKK